MYASVGTSAYISMRIKSVRACRIFEFIIYSENLHVSATFFVAIFREVLYEGYVTKLTTDI